MGNDANTVTSTMWLMVLVQTIGSVDMPGKGERKLPAPRAYVAIIITWTILEFMVSAGFSKIAARMAVVLVLVGAVLGPFGRVAVNFLNSTASSFATQPPPPGS